MRNLGVRLRVALTSAVLAASVVTQAPAFAAAIHVKADAAPATVRVGGTVTVTGSVSPKGVARVTLQRLVGRTWTTVGHTTSTRSGSYVLSLHAPKTAGTLSLRVQKAGVASGTLHVRVVRTGFAVTATHSAATLTTAQPLVVAGRVSPKGKGSISLDHLVGTRWVSLAKTTLTKGSTYSFSKTLTAGSYTLRVSKPFTTTVASGTSTSFAEVVTVPVTTPPTTAPPTLPAVVGPVVTTTALPNVVVGARYSSTLVATSGTAPYSWSVASGSLPPGLSLLPSGVVFGTPTAVASFSFAVRATDALGHSGTGIVTAAVHGVAVRSWGYGLNDEYGDGTSVSTLAIATASLPGTTQAVASGDDFVLALQTDGTVYAWGINTTGQLGLGDTTNRSTPVLIPGLTGVTAIAAGENASYAVTASGSLYTWGDNTAGELGNGTHSNTTPVTSPTAISLANVVSVAGGNEFALALTGNGAVFGFGNGGFGTIGNGGNSTQVTTPTQANITINQNSVNVVAISASPTASYALLSDGTVQAWGLQEHGQLGHASTGTYQLTPAAIAGLTGVTALSCSGFEFCLALRADHTVDAWGYGVDGEMGVNHTFTDGETPAAVPGLTGVTEVAAAHQTAFALHADGTVSSWGLNDSNQTGNGDTSMTPADVSVATTIPGLTGVVGIGAGSHDGYAVQAR